LASELINLYDAASGSIIIGNSGWTTSYEHCTMVSTLALSFMNYSWLSGGAPGTYLDYTSLSWWD